jgi:hypothetical protein
VPFDGSASWHWYVERPKLHRVVLRVVRLMSVDVSRRPISNCQNVARIHRFSLRFVVSKEVLTASNPFARNLDVRSLFLQANAMSPFEYKS